MMTGGVCVQSQKKAPNAIAEPQMRIADRQCDPKHVTRQGNPLPAHSSHHTNLR